MRCPNCGQLLPEGMRFCGYCGTPLPTLEKEEERKLASVMFVDVAGFTRLSEQRDPEEVSELLDRFYRVVDDVVRRHQGHVDKLIGDAALVLFGVPRALENPPYHAIQAALELVEKTPELGIQVHVGIHTGEVLVTHMGEGVAADYTVIGDTVNVAQRLESLARAGEILVSDRTWRMVEGLFEGESVGELTVKGRTQPIRVWMIHGRAGRVLRRGLARKAPLRGRDRELALLTEILQEERDALVALVADAGFGKSRLLDELKITPDLFLTASPDRPVGGMFRGVVDVESDLDEERAFARVLEKVRKERDLVVRVEDLHWADDFSLGLLERLVVAFPGRLLLLMTTRPDGEDVLNRLVRAFRMREGRVETLRLEGLPRPVLETLAQDLAPDLPETLKDAFVERAQGNPLFLEEMIRTWLEEGREDLPERIEGLMQERVDRLPAELKDLLKKISVLGPRFGERELALLDISPHDFAFRRLIQTGWLRETAEGWAFRNPVVRDAVYRMLLRRERKTLHERILEALEKEGAPAEVLAFHAVEAGAWEKVLQYGLEAAERFLSVRAIRDLGRVVRWMEEALNQGAGDEKQRQWVAYYRAEWLRNTEGAEAIRVLDHILNQPAQLNAELRTRAVLLKAEILADTGRSEEAIKLLQRFRPPHLDIHWLKTEATIQLLRGEHLGELARRLDREVSQKLKHGHQKEVQVLALPLLQALRYAGEVDRALEVLDVFHEMLSDQGMEGLQARLWHEQAEILRLKGRFEEAREAFEQALERVETLGDRSLLGSVLFDYARLLRYLGEPAKAREFLERALRVGKSLESFGIQFHSMVNLALNALDEGDLPGAYRWLDQAENLARQLGNVRSEGMVFHLKGGIRMLFEGAVDDETQELLERALHIAMKTEEGSGIAINAVLLGWHQLVQGNLNKAGGYFDRALEWQPSATPGTRIALSWGLYVLRKADVVEIPSTYQPGILFEKNVKEVLQVMWPSHKNLWRVTIWILVQKKGEGVIPLARELGVQIGVPPFLLVNLPFKVQD